jgi:hypothetical protein
VIATDRPTRVVVEGIHVHNMHGPAIEYPDGFRIYARHGARTPKEAIDRTLTWTDIKATAQEGLKATLLAIKMEQWAEDGADGAADATERCNAAKAVGRIGGIDAVIAFMGGDAPKQLAVSTTPSTPSSTW